MSVGHWSISRWDATLRRQSLIHCVYARWFNVSALTNYYRRTKSAEDFVVQKEEFINAALLQCVKEEFRK